jgi:ABC-type multidrug transport system permease subunit
MHKHYKEAPQWWYLVLLLVSFVLGLIVVIKENITLPVWGYVVSLLTGTIMAPFVSHSAWIFAQVADQPKEHNTLLSLW